MRLGEFLLAKARDGLPWNCSTLPADWCMSRGHADFAARYRDVTGVLECEEAAEGRGLVALWEDEIGDSLPVVTGQPEEGDIGVIRAHGMEAGAIYSGVRWVLKARSGYTTASPQAVEVVKVWRP